MKKKDLFENKILKNIIYALVVIVFGFILLNLTFLFDALYQGLIRGFVGIFLKIGQDTNLYWLPLFFHGSFVIVIGAISLFIFKSKLKTIYKAVYLVVPLAVVFATIGVFFYMWPILVYLLGTLFASCVLYYLYRTKQPWIYYYTTILVGITMLIVGLLGVEI